MKSGIPYTLRLLINDGAPQVSKMIELSKQLEELMEEMSNIKYDGIHHQWTMADNSRRQVINNENIAKTIEEYRQEIGLNSSEVLGEYIFALFMRIEHDRPWINVLMLSEEQARAWDSDLKEKFKKKVLSSEEDIQLIRSLAKNPYMMERFNINKKMLSDMESEVEQEAEADLDLASLYDKPYKYKKDDMYLRQCENNLWVEMSMQLEPSIPETKQLDLMKKLMGEFKYDSMHIEDKQFKYDTSSQRVRLKKRRQRALKDYRSSVFALQ